ncbi:hypothetical protein [Nocardia grenadensis]|uniref:hypothetical protein n=1 Tax=Nocardia grenadensis TaxID=931537 RepID=UPI003D714BFC
MSKGDDRPGPALAAGTRVKVIKDPGWDGPWREEFFGTVDYDPAPPEPVTLSSARPGELVYWVTFDETQYDADDAGPYRKAQVWDRYLVVADQP